MSEIPHTNVTRMVVKNYRTLVDLDIALTPLTVFVGKNATGKSNVIDVLRFVRDALVEGFDQALFKRGGIAALRYWFADENEHVSIGLFFKGPEWSGQYSFAFASARRDEYEIKSEKLSLTIINDRQEKEQEVFFEVVDGQLVRIPEKIDGILMRSSSHPKAVSKTSFYLSQLALVSPTMKAVRDFLANTSFYDFFPLHMRAPQQATQPVPLLENGSNLAATLREIQRKKKDYLITQALEVVVKGIEGYSVIPVGKHLVTKLHYAFQNGHSQKPPSDLSDESDGTIRVLAMLAALYQERYPSPLAIEEPEKAIYSRALALCGNVLQEGTLRYQVLLSTHSPDLIDHFPLDSFLVVEKEDGVTKIGPIRQNQRHSIEKRWFSTGEIMQMEGLQREVSGGKAT